MEFLTGSFPTTTLLNCSCSPILPVHGLELAVLLAVSTMPCRVLAPNCKFFQCGGQEQEQLVNTAPPQLPELRLHKLFLRTSGQQQSRDALRAFILWMFQDHLVNYKSDWL